MKKYIITHKDGSQSFVTGGMSILKNKESIEDQKKAPTKAKIEDIEIKNGKVKMKKSKD